VHVIRYFGSVPRNNDVDKGPQNKDCQDAKAVVSVCSAYRIACANFFAPQVPGDDHEENNCKRTQMSYELCEQRIRYTHVLYMDKDHRDNRKNTDAVDCGVVFHVVKSVFSFTTSWIFRRATPSKALLFMVSIGFRPTLTGRLALSDYIYL
jgi:hypothetical protein